MAFQDAVSILDPARKWRSSWDWEIRGGAPTSFPSLVQLGAVLSPPSPNLIIPFWWRRIAQLPAEYRGLLGKFAGCIYLCGLIPGETGVPRSLPPHSPRRLTLGPEGAPPASCTQAPLGCLWNVPLEKKGVKWGSSFPPCPLPSELPVWVRGPRVSSATWVAADRGQCATLVAFLEKVMFGQREGLWVVKSAGCGP